MTATVLRRNAPRPERKTWLAKAAITRLACEFFETSTSRPEQAPRSSGDAGVFRHVLPELRFRLFRPTINSQRLRVIKPRHAQCYDHSAALTHCLILVGLGLLPLCIGCGTAPESAADSSPSASNIDASQYLLTEEPADALGVIDARESAKDGTPLVMVGRIGGSENPWIVGRAAFTLLDASMTLVAKGDDSGEGELCTGDCCATERLACTVLVKVIDAEGRLLPVDSRELLGLNEADMVVVQGKAKKDENGNFVMLANGVYIRR